MDRKNPLPGHVLMAIPMEHLGEDCEYSYRFPPGEETTDLSQATTITSQMYGMDLHRPVLDLDMPVRLYPSSTPGHHHLYVDKPMTWDHYVKLLDVLAEVGLIQPGYASASKDRGYTRLRLPWVRKPSTAPAPLPAAEQARAGVMDGAL